LPDYLAEEKEMHRKTIHCPHCAEELEKLGMPSFSFNKPEGACETYGDWGMWQALMKRRCFIQN
jgi:excinuclease ABC subunit A